MKNAKKIFIDRLNTIKHDLNLTWGGLAEILGITEQTIYNYLKGNLPHPEVLIKMSTKLNMSVDWLLGIT